MMEMSVPFGAPSPPPAAESGKIPKPPFDGASQQPVECFFDGCCTKRSSYRALMSHITRDRGRRGWDVLDSLFNILLCGLAA